MSDHDRAYELRGSEEPAAGIRRIARGRIDNALDQLRGDGADTYAKSVHEARKDLKKLRSVLRLVRAELEDEVYRRESERFRDAGRLLSGARDAEVKLATIDVLREAGGEMPTKQTLRRYIAALRRERDRHAQADGDREELARRIVAEVQSGRDAVEDWALGAKGWSLVGPGLLRGYRRGRGRFAEVHEEPSDENVHEWRKRVKDLWYHLRILRGTWPSAMGAAADEAHRLADLLGDHHDLAVLAADARGGPDRFDSEGDLSALLRAAEARQDALLGEALGLGARLYGEKPKAFAKRHAAYWRAWTRAGD